MVCKRCGKALSSKAPTCPFCGAFISEEQIPEFVEMKKEKEKEARPALLSEQYGLKPFEYEKSQNKTNSYLFFILGFFLIVALLFLIVLFILF